MNSIGVHTYFGGFAHGMRTRTDMQFCVETWDLGIKGATISGLPLRLALPSNSKADIVFSNPPCSRFSYQSSGSFNASHRKGLSEFCELQQAVKIARACKAKVFWWETGPLAYGRHGASMLVSTQRALGAKFTIAVHYDLRYAGIPQRRPRAHVIHFMTGTPRFSLPPCEPLLAVNEWLGKRLTREELFRPHGLEDVFSKCVKTPMDAIRLTQRWGTFSSTKPHVVWDTDRWTPSINARVFAWGTQNRYFDILELGELMSYPHEAVSKTCDELGAQKTATLIAKSVSATAAINVFDWVVNPSLTNKGDRLDVDDDKIYRIDLTKGDISWRDGLKDKERETECESILRRHGVIKESMKR